MKKKKKKIKILMKIIKMKYQRVILMIKLE